MPATNEIPTISFASASEWEQWLAEHHTRADGVWIKVAKKASGIASVTHDEALDVALCYGWIDGQRNSLDDSYFLQKFTPRRPKSLWSKRNIDKIAALTAAGRMQPPGLAEVAAAKQDGRWDAAYDSPKNMVIPEDFLQALAANERARAFFDTLTRPTATPSPGGCRPARSRRRGSGAARLSSRCSRRARRFIDLRIEIACRVCAIG